MGRYGVAIEVPVAWIGCGRKPILRNAALNGDAMNIGERRAVQFVNPHERTSTAVSRDLNDNVPQPIAKAHPGF